MVIISLRLINLVSLLLVFSCSLSSIKSEAHLTKNGPQVLGPIEFEFLFKRLNENETIQSKTRGEWFLEGLVWGEDRYQKLPQNFLVKNHSDCKVDVTYEYDGNSFSSWKTWLSGGTLFIIPVKFKTEFKILITKGKSIQNKAINMDTWKSILLFPASPFVTSESEMIKLIGQSVRLDVVNICKN